MLVAGSFSSILRGYELDIANKDQLTLDQMISYCQQAQLRYEQILITDDGMIGLDNYAIKGAIANLALLQEKEGWKQPVLIITNRVSLSDAGITGVRVESHSETRIPIQIYLDAISGKYANATTKKLHNEGPGNCGDEKTQKTPQGKRSIIERFRKEKVIEAPALPAERDFEQISREISRVLAITGHRGAGVTSTAVNLAQIANDRNLSTILIDLDTVNCAINLYFSKYYEMAEKSLDIAFSLIRNLAKPQNYSINSCEINNLYVVTLAYAFSDKELLERFYTPIKFINMLTVFRKHFQLCLLDMPMEVLGRFRESILYVDTFGLCVSNNLHSLTSTLRGLQYILTQEETELLFGKSKIIVSKFNERITIQDDFFSPEKVCDLLLELGETPLAGEFELAGYIPYHMGFDAQLETDIPIAASDAYMEKAYSDILLRMIKGVG